MQRTVRQIIPAQLVNMGGIILDQALPYQGIDQIDPFLLIHHWSNTIKGGKRQNDLGVGAHPHRGFSPVTFVIKGGVLHQDSLGTRSEVFAGGVQWMNSGRGVIHSERPVKELAEFGGDFEIIQLWINTPMQHKMDPPEYFALHKKVIPIVESPDGLSKTSIIAGQYEGQKGSIHPFTNMNVYQLSLRKGGKLTIPTGENDNTLVYLINGRLKSANEKMIAKDLCWYKKDGKFIEMEAIEDSEALFLSGQPLHEPVFSHGPFVMDSKASIVQALDDYQRGLMGTLKEVFD